MQIPIVYRTVVHKLYDAVKLSGALKKTRLLGPVPGF